MNRFLITTAMTLTLAGAAAAQTADVTTPVEDGALVTPMEDTAPAGTMAEPMFDENGMPRTTGTADGMAPMDDGMLTEDDSMMATTPLPGETGMAGEGTLQVPGFLASDFSGLELYALDPQMITADGDEVDASDRWTNGEAVIGARADWEEIGNINDTILSQDGQVRGVLVDIGGFLGLGSKTVMVDMAMLSFVPNDDTAEDISDFYAVAGVSRDQLEALPEWTEESLVAGYPWSDTAAHTGMEAHEDTMTDTQAHQESSMATGGPIGQGMASEESDVVSRQTADEPGAMPTADELLNTSVVDGTGDSVGTVQDVVLDQAMVTGLIVDVGGFLGMGTHTVSIPFDGTAIVRNVDTGNVDHVQTSLTREQLEALPAYE